MVKTNLGNKELKVHASLNQEQGLIAVKTRIWNQSWKSFSSLFSEYKQSINLFRFYDQNIRMFDTLGKWPTLDSIAVSLFTNSETAAVTL